jgi:hypothetical protein
MRNRLERCFEIPRDLRFTRYAPWTDVVRIYEAAEECMCLILFFGHCADWNWNFEFQAFGARSVCPAPRV